MTFFAWLNGYGCALLMASNGNTTMITVGSIVYIVSAGPIFYRIFKGLE